jgi:hypothetical protein
MSQLLHPPFVSTRNNHYSNITVIEILALLQEVENEIRPIVEKFYRMQRRGKGAQSDFA